MSRAARVVVVAAVTFAGLYIPVQVDAADARQARLPAALSNVEKIRAIFPDLYQRELSRKPGPEPTFQSGGVVAVPRYTGWRSWERLRRAARTTWMRTHPCADATLERRYRIGAVSMWATVEATWECDVVPTWTRAFLRCAADHEGGREHPDVWFGGSRGWQGGRFKGTDRVLGPIQSRPYHARKIVPALAATDADRTVTEETFGIITDPVNHARIAARVGVGAFAGSTQQACS